MSWRLDPFYLALYEAREFCKIYGIEETRIKFLVKIKAFESKRIV